MFYIKGIDITNDKQMFSFLKNHFEYSIFNSWNRLYSIANNVKLHTLGLSGDWYTALSLLESGEYDNISFFIQDWMREHPGFEVYFNGRSSGYLVLKNANDNYHVLPEYIVESEDYEEYKRYCKEYAGSVRANRDELVYYTKLVQDFDKLCDELRDYCDQLSNLKFEVTEMQKIVEQFNDEYMDDLEVMEFNYLECDADGEVDITEISMLQCMREAFCRIADRTSVGYKLVIDCNRHTIRLQSIY
jgi:hypothetical protein